MNRKLPGLLFIFLLMAVSFFYQYHQIIFKRPQSVHAWRQADGASLALNYAMEGMHFFKPQVHNLTSDDGTTGKSATSEIPLLYYFVAILYKFFGPHEFIYRLVNTLFFFTGLFYLFRGIKIYTGDLFWSFTIPLSLFASPVLVYYANNFLSDTTALSMVLIAWYFVFRYLEFHERKDLLWMFFFFFLGGALKITALLSFFALAMIFLLEWARFFNANQSEKLFPHTRTTLISGIITLLPIAAWILYARIYNETHTTTYFSTTLFPIWTLDKEGIQEIIFGIRKLWLKEYFHLSFLYFLAALAVIPIIFLKKTSKFILLVILFLIIGMGIYIILQFWTFRDHDYYTINIFILTVFLMLAFARILKALKISSKLKIFLKTSIAIFLIFNIIYAHDTSLARYTSWRNDNFKRMKDFYTITPVLRSHGITREDTVISFSDLSHVSLYLMDQKGWTRYTDMKYNREEPYYYNRDSAGIQQSIDKGAEYLIVNGFGDLFNAGFLKQFTHHLSLSYHNIMVFEPKNPEINFSINNRKILDEFYCSAEYTDAEGINYTDSSGTIIFKNGNTRSPDFFLSGKHSARLSPELPYGMTFRLEDFKFGESVNIRVWKKGENTAGVISMQTEDYQVFHRESKALTGRKMGDWVEMELDFFIPYELQDSELKIFLYNPGGDTVYFDDLRIKRFRSVLE